MPKLSNDLWQSVSRTKVEREDLLEIPGLYIKGGKVKYHASHAKVLGRDFRYPTSSYPSLPETIKLYPQQEEGREWLLKRKGGVLAFEMRMGKTLTALSCVDDWPLVIVAPLMVEPVWRKWCERLFPDKTFSTFHPKKAPYLAEITFLNYKKVPKLREALGTVSPPTGCLILDEAHRLANRKNTRVGLKVANLTVNSRRRIALTGSPMWNLPKSLWGMLSCVNPGAWGSYHDFGLRYCDGKSDGYGWSYKGLTNEDELRLRLEESLLRNVWKDWGGTNITRESLQCEIPETVELRQKRPGIQDVARYRKALGLGKVPFVLDRLRSYDFSHLVCWTYHREVGEALVGGLSDSQLIHGGQTLAGRVKRVDKWKAHGGILVLTMNSAQEGIDLSEADTCVFAELDYSPTPIAQAEMRIYEPGRGSHTVFIGAKGYEDELSKYLLNKGSAELDTLGVTSVPMEVLGELSDHTNVDSEILATDIAKRLQASFF